MTPDYHHGDLRRTLLSLAADHVARSGPAALSLRVLAAEAGVSHAAPRHHFGSKEGLLTALAAEGYSLLADELAAAADAGGDFAEVGVIYLRFCLDHPGHFAVMFDPDLVDMADPGLMAARRDAFARLQSGASTLEDDRALEDGEAALAAAWALMHGLVVLDRSGALDVLPGLRSGEGRDLPGLARRAAGMLFGPGGRS